MKKVLKRLGIFLLSLLILFLGGIVFSFLFPKVLSPLDSTRLFFQSKLLRFAGETILGDMVINEDGEIIQDSTYLSLEEILPYIDRLEEGDLLFLESDQYLSSILTPGKWTHAAIYLGDREILDASSEGVKIRTIQDLSNLSEYSFLKSLIAFRIVASKEDIQTFLQVAKEQIGKEYNFDFDTEDTSSFYCSQLLKYGLESIGLSLPTTDTFFREITSPDDAVNYILGSGIQNNEYHSLFFLEKNGKHLINNFE